jgi:tetratricopeptide (TPR) repeat protein
MKYTLITLLFAILLGLPFICQASSLESELKDIQNNLLKQQDTLLSHELTLDSTLIQRMKYDGMGGIFSGSAKKKLERRMAESEADITRSLGEVKELEKRVQTKIQEIGDYYKSSGDYEAAIKWYLRLLNRDDKVKFKISRCYKSLENYSKAVEWLKAMAVNDTISFEISDCYRLDQNYINEITWLFKTIEPYGFSAVENKALNRLESHEYAQKLDHFPKYFLRIHKTFMTMTFKAFSESITKVDDPYLKAVEYFARHYGLTDNASASSRIVDLYRQKFEKAQADFNYQTKQADEYYLSKLREAERRMDQARRYYDDQLNDARRRYDMELKDLQDKIRHWRKKVKELEAQTTPAPATPQEINSAKRWVEHYKREYDNLNSTWGRDRFIENYTDDAKRRMERARREYEEIIRNRTNIIEEYLKPYKAQLSEAREEYKRMDSIHSHVFGN